MAQINIWTIGNTGLRSINRTYDGLRAFANSSLVGHIHGTEEEKKLESLLLQAGAIDRLTEKSDGTYARKWRLSWVRSGFIRCRVKSSDPFKQDDIGPEDTLTPLGQQYANATTLSAQQELYLRVLSVPLYAECNGEFYNPFDWQGHDKDGHFFSPLLWTLKVMFSMEKLYGTTGLTFEDFSIFVQTSCPESNSDFIANQIHEFETQKNNSEHKKRFNTETYKKFGESYSKSSQNFHEYGDMNLRYLRMTGIFAKHGRGIILRDECLSLAKGLLAMDYTGNDLIDNVLLLYNIPSLPTDNIEGAKESLNDLTQELKSKGISYDLSSVNYDLVSGVNTTRTYLQNILDEDNEKKFAYNQRFAWQEISEYLSMLSKGRSYYKNEELDIEIPSSEAPAYLEWTVWRSLLAIDNLSCPPDKVRSFSIDHDMLPVNTAAGNMPDLIAEYKDFELVGEVTLSGGSRQEAMEGEPVRRHVAVEATNTKKKVYGMFIAGKIDTNTAETFRTGVWYLPDDSSVELTIIPLTIDQYKNIFDSMFASKNVSETRLIQILQSCGEGREKMTAPEWKKNIEKYLLQLLSN